MATTSDVRALTNAHRAAQVKRAAAISALVMAYYSTRVDPGSPAEVERWLSLMVPRVLKGSEASGRLAAAYATNLRLMELPSERRMAYDTAPGSIEEQVRRSLVVVGPQSYLNKASEIDRLDISPSARAAMMREAKSTTAKAAAAATLRHVQSGGRATLLDSVRQDTTVIGWVRVTRDKPCFFCAVLASRGPVFEGDSFELSNTLFEGPGEVKVHDQCQCSLKPIRDRRNDPLVADTEKFSDMWTRWGAGGTRPSGASVDTGALLRFRRGYEHWLKTGEFLDWATVASTEAFRSR